MGWQSPTTSSFFGGRNHQPVMIYPDSNRICFQWLRLRLSLGTSRVRGLGTGNELPGTPNWRVKSHNMFLELGQSQIFSVLRKRTGTVIWKSTLIYNILLGNLWTIFGINEFPYLGLTSSGPISDVSSFLRGVGLNHPFPVRKVFFPSYLRDDENCNLCERHVHKIWPLKTTNMTARNITALQHTTKTNIRTNSSINHYEKLLLYDY